MVLLLGFKMGSIKRSNSWINYFLFLRRYNYQINRRIIIAISERNILKGTLPKSLSEKLNSGYLPQVDDRFQ